MPPLQILLIEDDAAFHETLREFLEAKGHNVVGAMDGASGIRYATENSFDAILCDIGLPDLDGFEVVKQLRTLYRDASPVIIAMTGYGKIEGRSHAIRCGFDDYLLKPIKFEVILLAIENARRSAE